MDAHRIGPCLSANMMRSLAFACSAEVPGRQWLELGSEHPQQRQRVLAPHARQPGPQLPEPLQSEMPSGLPPQPDQEPQWGTWQRGERSAHDKGKEALLRLQYKMLTL